MYGHSFGDTGLLAVGDYLRRSSAMSSVVARTAAESSWSPS
jgi:hypothetical protein